MMTDFEYDSYLKKNIAHSAMRKKGGSKSRRCPLSTDNMSHKEWIERCGEVVSYQIGKPMCWSEFSKLPKDLKEEYMNGLISKYSMNARNFAEMFGVSVATVFRLVKNEKLNVVFVKGRKPSGEQGAMYEKFICGDQEGNIDDVATANENADEESAVGHDVATVTEEREQKTQLDSFSMSFSGEINVDMIANSLRYILGSEKNARIQIVCELK